MHTLSVSLALKVRVSAKDREGNKPKTEIVKGRDIERERLR